MKPERARNILARLAAFEKVQNKATDEIGWIAYAFGVPRRRAETMIEAARAWQKAQK